MVVTVMAVDLHLFQNYGMRRRNVKKHPDAQPMYAPGCPCAKLESRGIPTWCSGGFFDLLLCGRRMQQIDNSLIESIAHVVTITGGGHVAHLQLNP